MDSFNHTWLKIEKVAIVEERTSEAGQGAAKVSICS